MKRKEIHEHNNYNTYNFFKDNSFVKIYISAVLGLVLFFGLLGLASQLTNKISENKFIYDSCVNTCGEKHFSGIQAGSDDKLYPVFVLEFDRTGCIESCNEMYLKLRGK